MKLCNELLELRENVSIHQQPIRLLVTQVYKSTSYLNPSLFGLSLLIKKFHIF